MLGQAVKGQSNRAYLLWRRVWQGGTVRIKIRNFWYRLQASFWFLPAHMTGAAILLSSITIVIDRMFIYREGVRQ